MDPHAGYPPSGSYPPADQNPSGPGGTGEQGYAYPPTNGQQSEAAAYQDQGYSGGHGPDMSAGVQQGQKRPAEDPADAPGSKRHQQGREVVFRFLINERKKGAIIGKGGAVVKELQNRTGARIRVVEPALPNHDERVVIVSSIDDPSREHSPAQEAVYEVHRQLAEQEMSYQKRGQGPPGSPMGQPMLRLLMCHTQAGAVIGKSGQRIKDMKERSKALIRVIKEAPPAGLANDAIVEISGPQEAVQRALEMVTKQIRENPPRERPGGRPASLNQLLGAPAGGMGGMPPGGMGGAPPSGGGYPPDMGGGYPGPPMHGGPHRGPPGRYY